MKKNFDDSSLHEKTVYDWQLFKDFSNLASDPIILLDAKGFVFFKNKAFSVKLNNKPLVELSNIELSALIAHRFDFPMGALATAYNQSSIVKATKQEQRDIDAYLYLNFELGIHQVIFKPIDTEELLNQVLNSIPSRVFWKDVNSKFLGANQLFLDDLNLDYSSQLIGLGDKDFFPEEQAKAFITDDQEVMRTGQPKINIEEPITVASGENYWLLTNKVPIKDRENNIVGIMGSYIDNTEKKNHEQQLETLANTDVLTGLSNRNGLSNFLNAWKKTNKQSLACLLFIDLDGFKQVNDTLGHQTGDELLKLVGERIQKCASNIIFSARLGGDEFAVITTCKKDNQSNGAVETAKRLTHILASPFHINSHHINVNASIGITCVDFKKETWESAYYKADLALYEAKANGNGGYAIYNQTLSQKYEKIFKLKQSINSALDNEEFYLNIQPQFNEHEQLISAEILLRWYNKELGHVSPMDFIPVAEESGAIVTIGEWVLERAFQLIHQWGQQFPHATLPPLAINISARQFEQDDFVELFARLFKQYPIEPELIALEITESILIVDRDVAIKKVQAIHEMGLAIEIDDFGTGYSSLSYLSQLPIDRIKIDRSFIHNVKNNQRKILVIEGLINIGKSLNISVLAEGVETEEQKAFLAARGCNEYQGYLFSKPISEEQFVRQYIAP